MALQRGQFQLQKQATTPAERSPQGSSFWNCWPRRGQNAENDGHHEGEFSDLACNDIFCENQSPKISCKIANGRKRNEANSSAAVVPSWHSHFPRASSLQYTTMQFFLFRISWHQLPLKFGMVTLLVSCLLSGSAMPFEFCRRWEWEAKSLTGNKLSVWLMAGMWKVSTPPSACRLPFPHTTTANDTHWADYKCHSQLPAAIISSTQLHTWSWPTNQYKLSGSHKQSFNRKFTVDDDDYEDDDLPQSPAKASPKPSEDKQAGIAASLQVRLTNFHISKHNKAFIRSKGYINCGISA